MWEFQRYFQRGVGAGFMASMLPTRCHLHGLLLSGSMWHLSAFVQLCSSEITLSRYVTE